MNIRKSSYLLTLLAVTSLLITQCTPAAPTAGYGCSTHNVARKARGA